MESAPTTPRPALCSTGELFGGVERQLLDLCTYLDRRGVPPLLILFHDAELARQARAIGCEPIILSSLPRFGMAGPRRLAAVLAEHRVNVVHAHGYKAVVTCALAHRTHPLRMVRTVHGRAEPRIAAPVSWVKEHAYRLLETLAAHRTPGITCYVTEDLARACEKRDRRLDRRTIHNGIDPVRVPSPERPGDLPGNRTNLVVVGRVSAVKGIEFAIRALNEESVPASVHLNVIGSGPLVDELTALAEGLGLETRVHFLGFRNNVDDYLAHCDGLLMPSLHEGLPYVLLEAMARGVPLLTSRVAGLAEVLQDDGTALMFPVGDVPAIGAAIGRIVTTPELGSRLGDAARLEQQDRFTLDGMGDQYWGTYRDALG